MNSDNGNNDTNDNGRRSGSPPRQRARADDAAADPAVERAFDIMLETIFSAMNGPEPQAQDEHVGVDTVATPPPEPLPAQMATNLSSQSPTSPSSVTMDVDSRSQEEPERIQQQSSVPTPTLAPPPVHSIPTGNSDTDLPNLIAVSDDDGMPGLQEISDSESDESDADDVEMMFVDSDSESELLQNLADMPVLEPLNRPVPASVEIEMPPLERVPSPVRTNLDAVRTGSRRARVEDDDEADEPVSGPSASTSSLTNEAPSTTATGSADPNLTRPMRPLPRNGPPPLRVPPANRNPLFGAAGGVGQGLPLFDTNTMFRQMFNSVFGPTPHAPPGTNTPADAAHQPEAQTTTPNEINQGTHTNANPHTPAGDNAETGHDRQGFRHNFTGGGGFGVDIGFRVFGEGELPMGMGDGGGIFGVGGFTVPVGAENAGEGATGVNGGIPLNPPNPNNLNNFNNLLRAFFGEGGLASMSAEMQREDPERARRLIAALDPVPEGLIKRMERVGGAPGAHEDATGGAGEEAQCAVCWDSLLNAEGDTFQSQSQPQPQSEEGSDGAQDAPTHAPAADTPTPPVTEEAPAASAAQDVGDPPELPFSDISGPSSSPDQADVPKPAEDKEKKRKKKKEEIPLPQIVSLPCAHVFHSSCLLPWFARPGQTTCPVCRFNVDPENLTYKHPRLSPRPRPGPGMGGTRTRARSNTAPAAAAPNVNADAGPGAEPQPQVEATPSQPPLTDNAQGVPTQPAVVEAQPQTQPQSQPQAQPQLQPQLGANPQQQRDRPQVRLGFGRGALNPQNMGTMVTVGLDFIFGPDLPRRRRAHDFGPLNAHGLQPDAGPDAGAEARPEQDATPGAPTAANPANVGADGGQTDQPAGMLGFGDLRRFLQEMLEQETMPDFRGPMGAAAAGLAPADGAPAGVPNQGPRPPRPPPRVRKEWTLPAPPGLTLRQRVEKRECEAGLRCDDVSCGFGPTDEDPVPESAPDAHKTISVRRDHMVSGGDEGGATKESVCAHRFHPACLVDAGRVAGWGSRADEEGVEVSCPRCRAVGHVDKTEWEEGVRATEGQRFDNV